MRQKELRAQPRMEGSIGRREAPAAEKRGPQRLPAPCSSAPASAHESGVCLLLSDPGITIILVSEARWPRFPTFPTVWGGPRDAMRLKPHRVPPSLVRAWPCVWL